MRSSPKELEILERGESERETEGGRGCRRSSKTVIAPRPCGSDEIIAEIELEPVTTLGKTEDLDF